MTLPVRTTLSTRQMGDIGEAMAAEYLEKQGFEILGRNLHCRYGEIDLVAQKKTSLYFIEIKRRVGATHGKAIDAISPTKIKRIRNSANHFLFKNPTWQKLIPYFSVVAIDEDPTGATPPKIEFLPDAFT